MVPPNGASDPTPRFGERQKRLSPGRKVSPSPGYRRHGSAPTTPEIGSPTKIGNNWGFQLSSVANASISRRGGASPFVAPVRESWGAGLRSGPGGSNHHFGAAGLGASSSQKSLTRESSDSPQHPPSASGERAAIVRAGDRPWQASLREEDSHIQRDHHRDVHTDKHAGSHIQRDHHRDVHADMHAGSVGNLPAPLTWSRPSTPPHLRAAGEGLGLDSAAQLVEVGGAPGAMLAGTGGAWSRTSTPPPSRASAEGTFQEAAVKQLEAHAERLVVLQRMFEGCQERLQQLGEHVQRTGAEHRHRLEDLLCQQQQSGPATDQLSNMVHHMQWAENRIHLLISRVAAGEEAVEQLRHHTVGPGRASWDTWEVAQARKDLDSLRDQISQLRAGGLVTQQALSDAVEPLRRELKQVSTSARTAAGGERESVSLMETLMQDVMQVREQCSRGERAAHRETAAARQELQETSQAIRKEMWDLMGDARNSGVAACRANEISELRREFQAATDALRKELSHLAEEVAFGQQAKKVGLEPEPQASPSNGLQELAEAGAQFRDFSEKAYAVHSTSRELLLTTQVRSGGGLAVNRETQNASLAALEQAVEELRTWVLQLAPHCEQAAATQRALDQLRQDLLNNPSNCNIDREIVGLLSRTSLLRGVVVHGAASAMEALQSSALAHRKCDDLAMVSASQQGLLTKQEFDRALEDLKWEVINVNENAEQGAFAAQKVQTFSMQLASLQADIANLEARTELLAQPQGIGPRLETLAWSEEMKHHVENLFDKLWLEHSGDLQQEVCTLMSRTSLLRALAMFTASPSALMQGCWDEVGTAVRSIEQNSSHAQEQALSKDVSWLMAHGCLVRAINAHAVKLAGPESQ